MSRNYGAALRLAAYSFLILFFELALIRYLPANIQIFSYYVNFVLIATFVGMGAGLLAVRHARWLRWTLPPVALLLLGTARWLANVPVTAPQDPNEYLWAVFEAAPAVKQLGALPVVGALFVLCALFFVPLGAMMGEEFRRFRPLVAYSVDIAGSLLGIVVFGIVSYAGWVPWTWFALGFTLLVAASLHRWRYALGVVATAPLAMILVAGLSQPNERWSPYYRIDWRRNADAVYQINVNGSMHLTALDVSQNGPEAPAWVQGAQASYRAPYRFVERLDTVLVLGAGAGNDVAVLLGLGATHIDAVEIDPEIAELGRSLHFQRPYLDPRVETHVTDARAFLKTTRRKYDLVVFGTLDSQTLLSGMSSVRLDNYVYTLEALRAARDVLAPGGRLIMYHMSPRAFIAAKIFQALAGVFQEAPIALLWKDHLLFNVAFICGAREALPDAYQAVEHSFSDTRLDGGATDVEFRAEQRPMAYPAVLLEDVEIPTDDWPYLYLRERSFPSHYLKALLVVLAFSALLVVGAAGRELRGGTDLQMFLLGLGFLLLETKSVTEISLLFGSTWEVNLLVFSSILVMILLANWLVLSRARITLRPVLLALLASLAVGYLVPVRALAGESVWLEWLVGGIYTAAPIFFAGLAFATLFKTRQNSVRALGYNLFGAAVGGVLEYSVMLLGVKSLYLIAALAYVLVWVSAERAKAVALGPAPVGR